jgi:endoglucanase
MKKRYLFAAIALALVFCLSLTTCKSESGDTDDSDDFLALVENLVNVNFDTPESPQGFANPQISAVDLVASITIGWNLGNTLDAHPGGETSWGNPKTTKAMITTLKESGFNTIRIPVSWYKEAKSGNNITESWMKRVVEIVNYAAENDMYVILNTHHDEEIFKFMDKNIGSSKKAFRKIWAQISYVFRNYNEKLIFEGLNEPRTVGGPKEWQGGTAEEHKNLNDMHQIFVDTVRESGGNNDKRILMISTYAASVEADAVNGLTLPTDTSNTVNKLIVSTHSYSPWDFAGMANGPKTWSKNDSSNAASITTWINRVDTKFVKNGIPVIGGEFGAIDKDNEAVRAEWAEFYVSEAGKKGIKCVWWDDGGNFKLFNRNSRTFYFPQVHQGLMKGAGLAP